MNSFAKLIFSGAVLALAFLWAGSAQSRADLLAYEPFDFSPPGADVAGSSGGGSFGFGGAWTGDTSFELAAGSLTPPSALETAGNRVTAAAFGGNRDLDRVLSAPVGADNTTVYFSFLMQAEGTVGGGEFNGWFGFVLRAGARNIHVGKDSFSNVYLIDSNLGDIASSTVPVVADETHLFVLRADFLPGADTFRLFIDPATGGSEPLVANATLNGFDLPDVPSLGLAGPGAFGFDELRMGTTWSDVTPVPEPAGSVLMLLGLSVAGVVWRVRKWKS